jgi:hypothetical protein
MTTLKAIETFADCSKELISDGIYGNAWQMTSYLIQLMHKLECYYTSLNEQHPEDDFYTAQIATASALELINGTYNVPTNDEKFEKVKNLYVATIETFIKEVSDDAFSDLILISNLANFVAGMRTYAWNKYIEEVGPSEDAFKALKLCKRDEKAVELAVKTAGDVLFASNDD